MSNWVLHGKKVVREPDLLTWSMWMEIADRKVARDRIDPYLISTVFLGLDHQRREGPPVLFETVVSEEDADHEEVDCVRASTWEEAETEHRLMIEKWTQ